MATAIENYPASVKSGAERCRRLFKAEQSAGMAAMHLERIDENQLSRELREKQGALTSKFTQEREALKVLVKTLNEDRNQDDQLSWVDITKVMN